MIPDRIWDFYKITGAARLRLPKKRPQAMPEGPLSGDPMRDAVSHELWGDCSNLPYPASFMLLDLLLSETPERAISQWRDALGLDDLTGGLDAALAHASTHPPKDLMARYFAVRARHLINARSKDKLGPALRLFALQRYLLA